MTDTKDGFKSVACRSCLGAISFQGQLHPAYDNIRALTKRPHQKNSFRPATEVGQPTIPIHPTDMDQ
jgi:hypothetical protein